MSRHHARAWRRAGSAASGLPVIVFFLVIAAFFSGGRSASAEPPRFLVEVEQNQVTVGETFQVQVTLAASNDEISDYRPPEFKGLRVLYAARAPNQSTQMQFGSAGMIVQVNYSWRYQLAATHAGVVSIGPARVRINGQEWKSSVATISAGGAGAAASPSPGAPSAGNPYSTSGPGSADPVASGGPPPPPEASQGGSFIRLVADKTKVFVGEAISATWFLYMNQPHDKYDTVVEPRMEGFWSEDVTTPSRRGSLVLTQEILDGRPYQVGAILKKALFPLKPGRLTVTSMEADLSRVDFFGAAMGQQHVRSAPTAFDVSPLPSTGQPPGFDPGNVGRFTLTAHVDRGEVVVGDAVTLTVEISGRGNLRKVGLPGLPSLPGWKIYDPRITTVIDPATGLTGNKSAEILLLPERPGTVQVPGLVLAFFDPDTGRYEQAVAPGLTLKATGDVSPGSEGANAAAGKPGAAKPGAGTAAAEVPGTQNLIGDDIRPLRTRATLRTDMGATLLHRPGFAGIVVVPPILLAFAMLGLGFRDRRSADTEGRRQRLTRQRVLARLTAAEGYRRQHQVAPFFSEIERVIRESVATRVGRSVIGMQSSELRDHLKGDGFFSDAEIDRVVAALDECDRARFAPGAMADPDAAMAIAAQRASQLIARLAKRPLEVRPS